MIAIPGLFGGSTPPSSTVNAQPQAGSAQFFQPQQQPQADVNYNNLLSGLINQYNTGNTPPQQLYPQAQQQAQYSANIASPGGPLEATVNRILGNPYYGQQQGGANAASNYGTSLLPQLQQMFQTGTQGLAGQLQAANTIAGYQPQITDYAAQTAGLAPTLTGLSSQVAGGIAPTQGLGGQVAQTLPQYQALANQAGTLFPQSQALQQQIASLMNPVTGLAQGVGPNAAAINQLAGQPTGAPQLQGAAADFLNRANQAANQPTGAGTLLGGGQAVMNTAFDPQNALYNRTQQQIRDQQNAVNSMSGVGTSPYGAGVTGDVLKNFNIDWQNQQLARQAQGLGAAGSAFGQAQGLNAGQLGMAGSGLAGFGTGLGQASNLTGNQAGLYSQGAGLNNLASGIYGQAANIGGQGIAGLQAGGGIQQQIANILSGQGGQAATAGGLYGQAGGIGTQAGNLATGAGNLYTSAAGDIARAGALGSAAAGIYGQLPGTAAANTAGLQGLTNLQTGLAGLPAQTYGQQQATALGALGNLQQGANASLPALINAANLGLGQYNLPQTAISDLANYMKLGQNASLAGATIGQIGTQNAQSGVAGLDTLLGGGGGAGGLLFGSQGLGGALGLPSGGLLGGILPEGGLFGSLGPGASDFTGGGEVAAATGGGGLFSGIGDFISSIFGSAAPIAAAAAF